MHVGESIVVRIGLYFELVEPISIPIDYNNSDQITLEVSATNMMTAFRIQSGPSQEEQMEAVHKAHRFVNYLSFQTGLYVSHKRPKKENSQGQKIEFTADAIITNLRRLNLSDTNLCDVISNTSQDSMKLAHFSSGQKALGIKNWPEAIREFYLVIENTASPDKFRFLRHAISHKRLNDNGGQTRASVLKHEFDLDLQSDGSLDISNPTILNKLEEPAKLLRNTVWQHINNAEFITNIQN